MKIQVSRRSVFYILLAVLFVFLAVRYAFQIEIPRIVLTALVIVMALLGDRNETIAIAMGCMPMHQAIDFYIALIGCMCALIIKNIKRMRVDGSFVLILLMLIWELFHCFSSNWSPSMLVTAITPLLFVAVCLVIDFDNLDYSVIARTVASVAAYMGLLQIIFYIVRANGNLVQVFTTLGRLGSMSEENTLIGGAINPNTLGIITVLGMTGLLQIQAAGLRKKTDIALFFVLLLLGMLTQSRTFLACLFLMFVMVLIYQRKDSKKVWQILGSTILICILIVLVMAWVFPGILEDFVERFKVEDLTTGRGRIMGEYHRFVIDNPKVMFFGIGLSNFNEKVLNVYQISSHVPHNSIQEIVVAWGIPGIVMMCLLIFMIIRKSAKYNEKKSVMSYIPLAIILLKCMAGQLLTSGYTMIAFVFAYLSLCQNFTPTKKLD